MDGVHISDLRRANDPVDPQVTLADRGFTDADGFVGHLDVHGIGIGLGIDGHGADVQFLACADNAHSDFAAIGNQDLLEHV